MSAAGRATPPARPSGGAAAADPVAALIDVLREERAALAGDDPARLPRIAARKGELLQACEVFVARADAARRRALKPRIAEARRLNDENALMLTPRLHAIRARLAFLSRGNSVSFYGPDGLAQSSFGRVRRGVAA